MLEGHRDRLYTRFLNGNYLSDVEILEMLLFYTIQVKDVKPIARRLLDCFGSVDGVIEAPASALMNIEGVGKKTASFFKLLDRLDRRVGTTEKQSFLNLALTSKYMGEYFNGLLSEKFVVVLLSKNGDVLERIVFTDNEAYHVNIDIKKIVTEVSRVNPYGIIIAHNHLSGNITPSLSDDETTKKILIVMNAQRVRVHDHLIFSNGEFYSYSNSGKLDTLMEEINI